MCTCICFLVKCFGETNRERFLQFRNHLRHTLSGRVHLTSSRLWRGKVRHASLTHRKEPLDCVPGTLIPSRSRAYLLRRMSMLRFIDWRIEKV